MVNDEFLQTDDPADERARRMFLAHVARLERDQVLALATATQALVAEGADKEKTTKGYLFAWYEGPRLADQERYAFGAFFQEVVAALASALTGTDPHALVPPRPQRSTLMESVRNLFLPRREWNELGDIAIRLVENSIAPEPAQPVVTATWNAASAVWMRGRIPPELEAILVAPWVRAVGEPPA